MTSLAASLRAVLIRNLRPAEADAVQPDLERWMREQLRYYLDLQKRALREEWNRTDKPAGKAF